MNLLGLILHRRPAAALLPEPCGPWAVIDTVFYDGSAVPPIHLIGLPHFAGKKTGPDGRVYADVCLATGPDAITSQRTPRRAYCVAAAEAWMAAADSLNPAPAEMTGGAA
jgi:hypothetical protein